MSAAVRYVAFLPRAFSLGGLQGATQRGLVIAFSTSVAAVMGTQLVYPSLPAMIVLDRFATSIGPILAGVLAAVGWGLPFLLYALAVPVAFLGLAWAAGDASARRARAATLRRRVRGRCPAAALVRGAKSAAPALMGALLVVADVTAVFWVLGGLSLLSVALAAVLLPTWARRPRPLAA